MKCTLSTTRIKISELPSRIKKMLSMNAKASYLILKPILNFQWNKWKFIAKIQTDLEEVVNKHKIRKNCDNKEAAFILSKLRKFTIPHFYIIWKILKNPLVGRLIVAGYDWI